MSDWTARLENGPGAGRLLWVSGAKAPDALAWADELVYSPTPHIYELTAVTEGVARYSHARDCDCGQVPSTALALV